MAMNRIDAQMPTTTRGNRRFSRLFSGMALRLLLAFIISCLIMLAFFVSGVVSH
jgi:hypothetical protein